LSGDKQVFVLVQGNISKKHMTVRFFKVTRIRQFANEAKLSYAALYVATDFFGWFVDIRASKA